MTYEELTKSQMTIDDYIEYHKSSYEQWLDNLEKGEEEYRCESMAREHLKIYKWLSEAKLFNGENVVIDVNLERLTELVERLEKANEKYKAILRGEF